MKNTKYTIKKLLQEKYPNIEKDKLEQTIQRIEKTCKHIYLHLDNIILAYKEEKQGKQ